MLDLDWSQLKTVQIGNFLSPVGCISDGTFSIYWKQNMAKMGLYTSDNTIVTVASVLGTISGYALAIDKFGMKVTVGEAFLAIPKKVGAHPIEIVAKHIVEISAPVASIYASYVLGAMVGSAIHAMINVNGCPTKQPSFKKEVEKFSDKFFIRDPAIKRYILNDAKILGDSAKLGFLP